MFSSRTSKIFNLLQQKEQESGTEKVLDSSRTNEEVGDTITNQITCASNEITKETPLIEDCGAINKAFIREEEKVLTQRDHDVYHLEITRPSGHDLKDNQSEDDDDSIRDPNYEALGDESFSSEYEPTFPKHVVGDSDHVVADSDSTETPIEDKVNEARPKKGRKRKFKNQNRTERKKKRNSNEIYYNYKGREIRPKEFINYDCKCTLKCAKHVPIEIRKFEFERFWSLGLYDCQVNFIAAGVQQLPKKRLYGRNPERRKFSRSYKIQDKVVCREMYIKTFNITTFRVNTALKKFRGKISLTDQRVIRQGGQNKLPEAKIQEVIDQIKKNPKYKSHYRREQTSAEFLPPEMTIQKMYEMYSQEIEKPVSMPSYKKIFYQRFHLKFKTLKKDTCNRCDRWKIQIDNEIDPEKKESIQKDYNNHLKDAENAQYLRRCDFQLAKENEKYECLTFDLGKTLPLPRIPTNIVFYKRQLWVYNCGIHNGKQDQGFCYVWAEGVAGRGAQEVGSCLLKHINAHIEKSVQHLILWSDSCGGQNRNIKLTLMLKAILHESSTLTDITLKFLCSGHSFLPNDSDFAQIESALKNQQRLYLPSEYVKVMKQCRRKKPFVVTEMNTCDFLSVNMIEKKIVNRKTSIDGQKINSLKIRSIKLKKEEPFLLTVQHDSFDAPVHKIDIKKRTEGTPRKSNHVTRTAGWLPPADAWKCGDDSLPYGWERALDDSGRTYYINHVNKTTTYENPSVRNMEPVPIPEPRSVKLERSPVMGFGFVAGSEKPVVVRFVTEGGPSVDKLMPGDQILTVNNEDVKNAPREHVISLVRACSTTVTLIVCQPFRQTGARKSTFLSASKRARLRSKPSRVRFAESVCVNGAPLFPPSAFSLGDVCVPPMANVLKVFLENGQTKSFKYDAWTTVQDVVSSLESKLCLQATEHFSLVVEHIKSLKRNKLTLLNPADTVARIASRPGAHKLRCLFRVAFVPSSAAALAQKDLAALDYLYIQCCNDVTQERFAPELQYDTALRLAALHIYQHALANNISAAKLTIKTVERDFGLERFVPASLLENMKRKEIHKVLAHFLKLHVNMAGPGKQLTALQAKLHYLDLVSQLPSYGAKCFSAGPRADAMERVILVSPKFGLGQIIGTRNSVPLPITNLEDIRRIEVKSEDEVSRTVFIRLQNERLVTITLEERDASELVLVLRGYFKLISGQNLPVDQEEAPPLDDLAPPYLSQHRVVPEKWSYINQSQFRSICFAMYPTYQNINHKTNGLYNTVGRQSKPPFMPGFSLDSNMNSSMTNNRNNKIRPNIHYFDKAISYDVDHSAEEALETSLMEAKNEDVLKRVQEMQQLIENSEKYLSEQEEFSSKRSTLEWQESSVDIESDTDSQFVDDAPGKLKHSDSLLLLTQGRKTVDETKHAFANAAIEILRSEINQSESDNDSICTPHNSPKHNSIPTNKTNEINNKNSRLSFGLRSPDNKTGKEEDLKGYLERLKKNLSNKSVSSVDIDHFYDFDPDIIDLTMLPPPVTPDELDCALPTPINKPPTCFADSSEYLDRKFLNGILHENVDLEEFLASVTVPPPIQKATPAIELTPEEIMSYIIPPPPLNRNSFENLAMQLNEENFNSLPIRPPKGDCEDHSYSNGGLVRRNSNSSVKSNIIEYSTVDRKGAFSCCAKPKSEKSNKTSKDTNDLIRPLPRRASDQKPPERPPKNLPQERQRSHSLTSNTIWQNHTNGLQNEVPPVLPPRGEANNQAPPHLFLPPKKPPLPPVPPLDVLRRKNSVSQPKTNGETRTACIGSPHLQRNRNVYNAIDSSFGIADEHKLSLASTAISTPTSPHLGRGAQLSTVPVEQSDTSKVRNFSYDFVKRSPTGSTHARSYSEVPGSIAQIIKNYENGTSDKPIIVPEFNRNGCKSTKENLLAKTDVAMGSLLSRLEQVATQCNVAQNHGGGSLMCEEKFQMTKDELTSQSLQLVTSSKMLVIAMSDPSLPDLPENLAVCLTILRRLTELCQDLANHTTSPLQTRNLILKVHDVTAAFRHLVTSDIDRTSQATIEEHLAGEAESLANVLATLLRSLRVFSP